MMMMMASGGSDAVPDDDDAVVDGGDNITSYIKECIQESCKLTNAAGKNGVATSNHNFYAQIRHRQYPPTRDINSECSNPPSTVSSTRDSKSQYSIPPYPISSIRDIKS
ncbi:hypothetical protein PoB_002422000 [Plakobranchus ocellatus]|uniref:Uncharacterized protein n=1 Tax=Plakobranchus ocellatus TaxID=259542 RepID=A0AAV3ZPR7_9GAST|nr:hypothetical protein PoB_002422000 [Plakobranchus ocellatus]